MNTYTIARWLTVLQCHFLVYRLRKLGYVTSFYGDTLRTNASRLEVFCAANNPRVLA